MNAAQPNIASTPNAAPAEVRPGDIRAFAGEDDFDRDVWSILGVPADMATAPEAIQAIETAVRDRRPLSFVTPNVNFLVRARKDKEDRRQILDSDLSLVDGAPLVAIGRLVGAPIRERCAGSDLFDALRLRPGFPGRRLRVFFFGGREGAAAAAAAAVNAEGRGVEAAGHLNPGHGDLASMSAPHIIDAINASNADFVLVALGAAKGQAWIDRNRKSLSAPVIAHLGAVIDFAAGTIERAPAIWRNTGLEWAWRIKEEPSLWRRYWNDGLALLSIVVRDLAAARPAPVKNDAAPAAVSIRRDAGQTVLTLSGDLVAGERAHLREAFRIAAARGRDVVLDLGAAKRIDAAFLGLVLMLEKHASAAGRKILLANASKAQRRIFAAHSMDYDPAQTIEAADVVIADAV